MELVRQQEIALKVLKYKLKREGVHLGPNIQRELGNVAKEMDIPLKELLEFYRIGIEEITNEFLKM